MASFKQPCIHCRTLIDRDARYCPRCASRSPFGYACPSCSRPIRPEDALCSGCGGPAWIACPACAARAFIAGDGCPSCAQTFLVTCSNKLCRQPQYHANTRCTACGKKLKEKLVLTKGR